MTQVLADPTDEVEEHEVGEDAREEEAPALGGRGRWGMWPVAAGRQGRLPRRGRSTRRRAKGCASVG